MRAVESLPQAFYEFERIGGVLEFAVFEDADGDVKSAFAAMASIVKDIDQAKLLLLGSRPIDDKTFYGEWYRASDDALMFAGTCRLKDGQELVNPTYRELDAIEVRGSASLSPEEGSGGQFAYAFSQPPYGLNARPGKIQDLFYEIRGFVLPPCFTHEISDWSSSRLPEASDYFSEGMEYWGVFLFTVYIPELRRLTAIAGSTTD